MNGQQLISLVLVLLLVQSSLKAQRPAPAAPRPIPQTGRTRNPVAASGVAAQAPAAPGQTVLGQARTVLPDGSEWRSGGLTAAGFSAETSMRGLTLRHARGFQAKRPGAVRLCQYGGSRGDSGSVSPDVGVQ